MNNTNLNPYDVCCSITNTPIINSLFEEFYIKLSVDLKGWVIKSKLIHGLATIRATQFDSLEINIPIATLELEKDKLVTNFIAEIEEVLNGQIKLKFIGDQFQLFYVCYIPVLSASATTPALRKYGEIIKGEINLLKDKIVQVREMIKTQSNEIEDYEEGLFNVDNFDEGFIKDDKDQEDDRDDIGREGKR